MSRLIKKLSNDDIGSYVDIYINAYPGAITPTFSKERKIEEWVKANDKPEINFYGCFQDEILVGGVILLDFQMNLFSDTIINVGGVSEVCVDLLRKKEHIAKDLMLFSHQYFYKKGFCLNCLYPFSPAFYRKMGYGIGQKMSQYRFEPKALPKTSKHNVSCLSLSDSTAVLELFNRYASITHGVILRSKDIFEPMLKSGKMLGYWKNKSLHGYLYFRFKEVKGGTWLQHDIEILELIYETPEALRGLLTFLATQQDQVEKIIYNTYDDSLQHLLLEPRSSRNIFHIFQESNIQGVGMMYRIINTSLFFRLLKDHNFGYQTVRLKITINDSFLPENNGSIVVQFTEGKPIVLKEGEPEAEIVINIDHFSSLVMGAISFKKLYEYELVEISNPDYLETVNALFLTESPPITFENF
ncbi:MAG: enhanced intracellular survival protein Eis [Candidatus Hodarchaeota archaeon]